MKFYKYLNEGTWAVPNTVKKAQELQKIMRKPINVIDAKRKLWNIIGDDNFYDYMEDAYRETDADYGDEDVREYIADWIYRELVDPKAPEKKWHVDWEDGVSDILKKITKKYRR